MLPNAVFTVSKIKVTVDQVSRDLPGTGAVLHCLTAVLAFILGCRVQSWIFWRYNILYVSERCFESGGRMWDNIFKQICACLFIFEFFTGKL